MMEQRQQTRTRSTEQPCFQYEQIGQSTDQRHFRVCLTGTFAKFRFGVVQSVAPNTRRGLRRRTVCQSNEEEKETKEVVKRLFHLTQMLP